MGNHDGSSSTKYSIILAIVIVIVAGVYLSYALGSSSTTSITTRASSESTTPVIDGVVTGYVTVGPSQPVCSANESCDVDLTGYSLEFASQCPVTSTCQTQVSKAALSPSGHYSVLLPAGNYTVTGLYPNCNWQGCSSTFPKSAVVEGGNQLVLNINIDTGIR
ncbi:MAG TPA: hypothetical protein VN739_08310 [Nitrososphaerales archaeon]|nr:hypothetical protein [Nitrososphaerales archaeon]